MPRSFFKPSALSIVLAAVLITGVSVFTSAASYLRTSLREMTTRAAAVAEVTVVNRTYPPSAENEFQRTHVEVTVNRTLKGSLPATITLDLPGGVRGNKVFAVADSADFQIGERAMVFIKEPAHGQYMVQDLGLGKFNISQRDDRTIVESAVCPKAMDSKAGAEGDLLTKAIPYDDFCALISSYAKETSTDTTEKNELRLAMALPNSAAHACTPGATCTVAMDAIRMNTAAKSSHAWLTFGISAFFLVVCAGAAVVLRRRSAKTPAPVRVKARNTALILAGALLIGAAIGGTDSFAYVLSGPKWNLDDTNTPSKIQNGKVVWKQSSSVSRTNSNCFADVQAQFDKWAAVSGSRLGFVNAGTTSNVEHSSGDNVNFVAWDATPNGDFSSSTLAITYSVFTVGGDSWFIDCDIIYNDRDFSWAGGGHGNIKSVSIHEIGHFIGLSHVNNNQAVMYPFDNGFTSLSNDEIAGCVKLYPGSNNNPPPPPGATPPSAVISASPTSGPPPLTPGFSAAGSAQGTNPIASYSWNFGDSAFASGQNASHTYTTPGNFVATLTVTDTQGLSNSSTIVISVQGGASSAIPLRGTFKLNFNKQGRDTFNATLLSQQVAGFSPQVPQGGSTAISGNVSVAGLNYGFFYSPYTRKAFGMNGLKVVLNPRNGTILLTLRNVNLQSALGNVGAMNGDCFGDTVTVPVNVTLGDATGLQLTNAIPFVYYGRANKSGTGKY